MVVGFAKKFIVADRLDLFVTPVFRDYANYDGGIIALGAILYTIQLYFDFSGCMDMALGMGRIFGVTLPENFRQPLLSKTASEFWQRWHITLGTWFKDYIYYPVSLSSPIRNLTKRARKTFGNRYGPLLTGSIALFCVWFCK
jgi:D-alanyl-lipoteichoic acid acyltransferase DltB (MBOAT superfamily)